MFTKKKTSRTAAAATAVATGPAAGWRSARKSDRRDAVGEGELREVEGGRERQAPGPAQELRQDVGREADQDRRAGGVEQQDQRDEGRGLEAEEVAGVADAQAEGERRRAR